jgi:hypothetical protein
VQSTVAYVTRSSHITCFMIQLRPVAADRDNLQRSGQVMNHKVLNFIVTTGDSLGATEASLMTGIRFSLSVCVSGCHWLGLDLDYFVPGLSDVTF